MLFSASKLRDALRSAGDIVNPEEVSEVLSYVASDRRYQDLDGLHLILLSDGSVKQISWNDNEEEHYFVFTDTASESIYELMKHGKHQLVESCSAWKSLSM